MVYLSTYNKGGLCLMALVSLLSFDRPKVEFRAKFWVTQEPIP